MTEAPTDAEIVAAVRADAPDNTPGTRPIHAIGIVAKGYFQATPAAAQYTTAEHFQGGQFPATVRFSNGSGSGIEHDNWPDVRGMATRFHLSGAPADLVMMSLPEFFVDNIAEFMKFTKAALPEPPKRESPWAKLGDMLCLRPPLPDPQPDQTYVNTRGIMGYADAHRNTLLSVFDVGISGVPTSYCRLSYHCVNSFVLVAPDGRRRYVRFDWQPVAGVLKYPPGKAPGKKFLHEELRTRIARWPARFILKMQVGQAGDAVNDPTRPFPKRRLTIEMGTLVLNEVPDDSEKIAEEIAFNPCRVPPGIDLSEDPILLARKGVYETSRKERGGMACPFHNGGAS
ncbi:MAG: catalase [Pseudomonadota bacterium]